MEVIRQNYNIRNMHSQKMGMRFSLSLLFSIPFIKCDCHTHKKIKWNEKHSGRSSEKTERKNEGPKSFPCSSLGS